MPLHIFRHLALSPCISQASEAVGRLCSHQGRRASRHLSPFLRDNLCCCNSHSEQSIWSAYSCLWHSQQSDHSPFDMACPCHARPCAALQDHVQLCKPCRAGSATCNLLRHSIDQWSLWLIYEKTFPIHSLLNPSTSAHAGLAPLFTAGKKDTCLRSSSWMPHPWRNRLTSCIAAGTSHLAS